MIQCRLIDEHEMLERQNTGHKYGDSNLYVEPGMMWFLPCIYDHQDPDLEQYLPQLIKDARVRRGRNSTSLYYLEDWATKRDPLAIMLPHAGVFFPDSCLGGSHRGYRVSGIAPNITIDGDVVIRNAIRLQIIDGIISMKGYSHG